MKLYSTLDKKIVEIVPLEEGQISIYSCGPTVYYRMHIGNIRAYVNWDIFHRALLYLGYDVNRVMNITDVGHMSSKDDFGDDFGSDKMDLQASKEGLQPIDIANKYIDTVLEDFRKLNILTPKGSVITEDIDSSNVHEYGYPRATQYVDEMIEIIKKIEANGYSYETEQAVYFDVTKIPDYTVFTGQLLGEKEIGVRDEVNVDPKKKNSADFVLWMKRYGKYEDHMMNWESPWGNGFPGWHVECTAMGTSVLGERFDIHTGGIDHIPVHHTNERAQNIGAFGHGVVKYWVHNEWLVTEDDEKISKSKGLGHTLPDVLSAGFDPMDIRYLFGTVNYRTRMQYSLEALEGARNARRALVNRIKDLGRERGLVLEEYVCRFKECLENNLNISSAMALINELLKSDNSKSDILATILDFDKVLGLDLEKSLDMDIDDSKLEELLSQRKKSREEKMYEESDRLRDEIFKLGYIVKDTSDGQVVEKV